jgi:hypothetical protein
MCVVLTEGRPAASAGDPSSTATATDPPPPHPPEGATGGPGAPMPRRPRSFGHRPVAAVRRDPGQALVLALPVGVIVVGGRIHRFVNDDGYINLRVVDQILAGHGPVVNTGERIEAVTSTAWLAVLAALGAVFRTWVDIAWIAVVAGLVAAAAAVGFAVAGGIALLDFAGVASGRSARPRSRAWPIGALVFVCTPPVWWYATSGLERGCRRAPCHGLRPFGGAVPRHRRSPDVVPFLLQHGRVSGHDPLPGAGQSFRDGANPLWTLTAAPVRRGHEPTR